MTLLHQTFRVAESSGDNRQDAHISVHIPKGWVKGYLRVRLRMLGLLRCSVGVPDSLVLPGERISTRDQPVSCAHFRRLRQRHHSFLMI